jgi:endonuclease/exonuclease/phosphatase family metal-dependent hydrolase
MLAGDFNATSITRPYRRVAKRLRDAQRLAGLTRTVRTFPSSFPVLRIDHVFVSDGVHVTGVRAPAFPLARMASDHLPLIVEFELTAAITGPDQKNRDGLERGSLDTPKIQSVMESESPA